MIGHPVAHSRSPAMHNAALAVLGLAEGWSYEAIDMLPEQFTDRTRGLRSEGFVGASVTIPHKHAALALADQASEAARAIGAANTLSFDEGGITAENTDAPGFLAALPESPSGRRALVLGAGGSARAVVWALVGQGARVEVWNRTLARAEKLGGELGAQALGAEGELPAGDFGLIVNATSVGMERPAAAERRPPDPGSDLVALRLTAEGFRGGQIVVDLTYGSAETELARAARASGATVIDGIEVLVRQGAAAFRIWTGIDPPLDAMRRAARG